MRGRDGPLGLIFGGVVWRHFQALSKVKFELQHCLLAEQEVHKSMQ